MGENVLAIGHGIMGRGPQSVKGRAATPAVQDVVWQFCHMPCGRALDRCCGEEALLRGPDRDLGARAEAELIHDPLDVRGNRAFGNHQ